MKGGANKKEIAKTIYKNMPKFIEKLREVLKMIKDFWSKFGRFQVVYSCYFLN